MKKYMDRKTQAQEKISELMSANFGEFKKFLAKKIVENMTEDEQKGVAEREAKREAESKAFMERLNKKKGEPGLASTFDEYAGSTTYSMDRFFNPYADDFEITNYSLNEDGTEIKLTVECTKNRGYLGITGHWVPDLHSTGWISIKEMEEAENK